MLIVQVYVNEQRIDFLAIHNISEKDTPIQNYRIEYPHGYEDKIFKHKRSRGYMPLLKQVLEYLIDKGGF